MSGSGGANLIKNVLLDKNNYLPLIIALYDNALGRAALFPFLNDSSIRDKTSSALFGELRSRFLEKAVKGNEKLVSYDTIIINPFETGSSILTMNHGGI